MACSDRRPDLREALGLGEPEDELVLIYTPQTAEVWGWGYSLAEARAAARRRMQALDQESRRLFGEASVEEYLRACGVMSVRVRRSQVLDLLRVLGVSGER